MHAKRMDFGKNRIYCLVISLHTEVVEREHTMMMSRHSIWRCMAEVLRLELAQNLNLFQCLNKGPTNTVCWTISAQSNTQFLFFFFKVSLTVGQTWVIVMEVLELILLSGDLRFLSHHGLLCPDFLPAWEEKIRELFFFLSSSYLHLCQKYNSVNICVIICESMWNCKYTFIPCLFNAQQWLLVFSFF